MTDATKTCPAVDLLALYAEVLAEMPATLAAQAAARLADEAALDAECRAYGCREAGARRRGSPRRNEGGHEVSVSGH